MRTWKLLLAAAFVGGLSQTPVRAAENQPTEENTEQVAPAEIDLNDVTSDDLEIMSQDTSSPRSTSDGQTGPHRQLPLACQQASINDAQKEQIHSAILQSKRNTIELRAQIKLAKLEYASLVADKTATADAANAANAKIADQVSKMVLARGALKTNILFNILTPEQRQPAFKCMRILRHMRRHHHHHAHGGHHTEQNRG